MVAVCPAGSIVNDVEVPRDVVVLGVATDGVLVTQARHPLPKTLHLEP
jgi:hypothetical protein